MLQKLLKNRGWQASCDACSEETELPDAESFIEALKELKEAGWRPVQVNGAWEHRCPACLEKEREDAKGLR